LRVYVLVVGCRTWDVPLQYFYKNKEVNKTDRFYLNATKGWFTYITLFPLACIQLLFHSLDAGLVPD